MDLSFVNMYLHDITAENIMQWHKVLFKNIKLLFSYNPGTYIYILIGNLWSNNILYCENLKPLSCVYSSF